MQVLKQFAGVIVVGLLGVLGFMSQNWTLVGAVITIAVVVGLRYLGAKVSALSMLTTDQGSAIANIVLAGGGGALMGFLTSGHTVLSILSSGVLTPLLSEGGYNVVKKVLFPSTSSTTPAAPAAPAAAPAPAMKK